MTTTTATTALPLVAGRWDVDPYHSSVEFTIRHLGISKVRGRFTEFEATIDIGNTLETTQLEATVHLASVDTGNADRDAHIQQPDMVDTTLRPTLTFRSQAIRAEGDGYAMDGLVSIGDVIRPLTLAAELGGLELGPDGRRHAGFEANAEIRRSDFGIAPQIPAAGLGDVIKVQLDIQLLEPVTDPTP